MSKRLHGGSVGDECQNLVACEVCPRLTGAGNVIGGDCPPGTQVDTCQGAIVVHSLHADGFDASEDGTGRGTSLVPIAFCAKDHGADAAEDICPTLRSGGHDGSHANGGVMPAIAVRTAQTGANGIGVSEEVSHTLDGADGQAVCFEPGSIARDAGPVGEKPLSPTLRSEMGDNQPAVRMGMAVRRLTPRECERLQDFPDDFTLVEYRGKPAADGPRYKALGNAVTVSVVEWIARRIEASF